MMIQTNPPESNVAMERKVLEKLMTDTVTEHRRSRRWKIFFRLIYLALFIFIIQLIWSGPNPAVNESKPFVAQINIDGIIASDALTSNADSVIAVLDEAFKQEHTKAIILSIDSPGGSAVESGRIYDEVRRLRALNPDIKVYAVVDEMATSAAYYIAASADQIYANRASLVGSIGVLIDGFGMVGLMEKLGIQRRLITAGDHKGMLDPFSPLKPEDEVYAKKLVNDVHQQFIKAVVDGRQGRLSNDPNLFSGLVWTGDDALKLGLIDGLGDANYVAREVIGTEEIVTFSPPVNLVDLFAMRLGASFGQYLTEQRGIEF
jgi:protease-4